MYVSVHVRTHVRAHTSSCWKNRSHISSVLDLHSAYVLPAQCSCTCVFTAARGRRLLNVCSKLLDKSNGHMWVCCVAIHGHLFMFSLQCITVMLLCKCSNGHTRGHKFTCQLGFFDALLGGLLLLCWEYMIHS